MNRTVLFFFAFSLSFQLTAQTHEIVIHENNRVASLLMTSTEYTSWINDAGFTKSAVRQALIRDIYQKFDDDFDFIVLLLNEDSKPAGMPYGQTIRVSNKIEGIGLSVFDNTADYGSQGKLKAVIHLSRRDYLLYGPALHEIMHNWGNFGIPTEAVSGTGTNLSSYSYRPHWGFTGGSTKGQLGGFKQSTLIDHGNGSYSVELFGFNANGGNSIPYNDMELYLMGMIPLSDVREFDVFSGITSLTKNGGMYDFEASTKTHYTPASIETLLGNRVPASANAQKNFKMLTIVLTDSPLTQQEWNIVDDSAEKFGTAGDDGLSGYNFWEATGGRGTMETGNIYNNIITSLKESSDNGIKVYPNPATEEFAVRIIGDDNNFNEFSLLNSDGQLLLKQKPTDANSVHFDVSRCPAGVYFLRIKNDENLMITRKVLIR